MLTIKNKIILLSIIPLILTMLAVNVALYLYSQISYEKARQQLSDKLYTEKQVLLNTYMDTLQTAIQPLIDNEDTPAVREQVKSIIRRLRYGKDGYFFAFDTQGINLVNPARPDFEGKSQLDLMDSDGKPLTRMLIDTAKNGGGYVSYRWNKPSVHQIMPKLATSKLLDKYQWILGTGMYIDDIEVQLNSQSDEWKNMMFNNSKLVFVAFMIALVLMLFITIILGSRITRPLVNVASALQEIASGDGDLTQRLQFKNKDEIGAVCLAFNNFVARIQQTVAKVGHTCDALSAIASKNQQMSEQINQEMLKHKQETDQVVTAVTEMNATSMDVSANAANAATATHDASNESLKANDVIDNAINSINDLVKEVNVTSAVIGHLEQETTQIGSVVDVIRGIADQINLLALNAAIEAARAGDHGRGFAVVADEVRSLAGRTQKSTQEINDMLQRLQQSVQKAVLAMNTSQSRSQHTVTEASKITDSLNNMSSEINTINDMNTQIATAAEQQHAVAEDINRSLVVIQHIVERLSSNTDASDKSTHELFETGQQLQSLIRQFRY